MSSKSAWRGLSLGVEFQGCLVGALWMSVERENTKPGKKPKRTGQEKKDKGFARSLAVAVTEVFKSRH